MFHVLSSRKDTIHKIISVATLMALVGALYAPGTIPSLALASISGPVSGLRENIAPHGEGNILGAPVDQTLSLVQEIAPGNLEQATPLQQTIMNSIEERRTEGLPIPSLASYESETVPSLSMARQTEAGPVQEFKVIYRTELHFDSPEQAGREKWPDVVVDESMPPGATGFAKAGDYTASLRDAAEQARPGIWEQYEFGQEPRIFVYEETYEVYTQEDESTAPQILAENPSASGDILFGFTNSFIYDYTFVMSQDIFGARFWAQTRLTYGWGAGIRLPVHVNLEVETGGETDLMQNSPYMLNSSIAYDPEDWDAADYEKAGLPKEKIWQGKELVLDAFYYVHVAMGAGEIEFVQFSYSDDFSLSQYPIKVAEDSDGNPIYCTIPQDLVTPFGDYYYPPEEANCPYLKNKQGGIDIFDFGPMIYVPLGSVSVFPFLTIDVFLGFGFIINFGLGSKSITAQWMAEGNASGSGQIDYSAYDRPERFGPVTAGGSGLQDQRASVRLNNWAYHPSLLLRLQGYPCIKARNSQTKAETEACLRDLRLKLYEIDLKIDAELTVHEGTPDSVVLMNIPVVSPIQIGKTADVIVAPVGSKVTITTTLTNIGNSPLSNVTITDNGVNVLDKCTIANNNGIQSCTYSVEFIATKDRDIASTTVVTGTWIPEEEPVQITTSASMFVPVLNGVVGSGTAESCTEKALDAELYEYVGDTIKFMCGSDDATVVISATKTISRDITIIGSNTSIITIDGGGSSDPPDDAVRVFYVEEGTTLNLQNLVVAHGKVHRPEPGLNQPPGGLEAGGGIFNLGTVNLQNVIITDNEADQGGGIHNSGTLHITDSTLSGNTATLTVTGDGATWNGGAIYNDGTLTIVGSAIENNMANGGGGLNNWGNGHVNITRTSIDGNLAYNGGGIENGEGGEVVIRDARIRNNQATIGGGIFNFETGRMIISSSKVTDNIASQAGGIQNKGIMGIQVDINNNDAILDGTTLLSGNQAVSTEEEPAALDGGGIYNDGALKIANTTIEHNSARGGGGILNWIDDKTSLGTVEIINSAIASNWAGNGGGIENGCANESSTCGTVKISNSSLFDNSAIYRGGGIANYSTGEVIVKNSTIASNTASEGGGINNYGIGLTKIDQSLIANNQGGNCAGTVTSSGYNLDSDDSCGFAGADNLTNIDPLLGSPTDNGGLTLTLALSPNSAAIDYIPAEACTVTEDQRGDGYPRPLDGNSDGTAMCDIGAFELMPPTLAHVTVTSDANSGPGSLRWALVKLMDGGTIDFAIPYPSTIKLTSELVIDKAVNIDGPGVHELTISGSHMTRLFKVMNWATLNIHSLTLADGKVHQPSNVSGLAEPGGGIFNLGTVHMQNTLLTGNEADQGGALHNSGVLTISGSVITDNRSANSSEGGDGGGIYNDGKLTVRNTAVIGNQAHGGGGILNWGTGEVELRTCEVSGNVANNGGGIENGDQGKVIIADNSTIAGNSAAVIGGGVANYDAGTVTIDNSDIASNTADAGGGVHNAVSGVLEISHSHFTDNSAEHDGGGIFNYGTATIVDSTFSGDKAKSGGGGLVNTGSGVVTINSSTFTGNTAGYGGAIQNGGNQGSMTITNTTISGNTAYPFPGYPGGGGIGGGLRNIDNGMMIVRNSTVFGNSASESGGGIHNLGSLPVEIDQSIVASNQVTNCVGPVISSGYNIDSNETCGFDKIDDLNNTDPLLGPLQDNGGPTLTHALLPGSPAIDAVDPAVCPPPATDQRGITRPQGLACDIGAYEAPSNRPPTTTISIAGTMGTNGWYRSNIVVTLSAQDNSGSGVQKTEYGFADLPDVIFTGPWYTYTAPIQMTLEGSVYLVYRSIDQAGNIEPYQIQLIKIDKTPPAIHVFAPQAIDYLHSAAFDVHWKPFDKPAGVAASSALLDGQPVVNGQTIDLFYLALGSHTVTVQANDEAGNTASTTVLFNVVADIDSLRAVTARAYDLGWISKQGVYNSLDAKLQAAQNNIDDNQFSAARRQLLAFINKLDTQNGKGINQQAYDLLKADALYVLEHLE